MLNGRKMKEETGDTDTTKRPHVYSVVDQDAMQEGMVVKF